VRGKDSCRKRQACCTIPKYYVQLSGHSDNHALLIEGGLRVDWKTKTLYPGSRQHWKRLRIRAKDFTGMLALPRNKRNLCCAFEGEKRQEI